MTDLAQIIADVRAEQDSLDAIVTALAEEQWRLPTSSPGWSVADQIGHLTYFDGTAALAIAAEAAFRASLDELLASIDAADELTLQRHLSPSELLGAWRANRARLADGMASLSEGSRVIWYGPSMSARSFLTARLMECWAHGQDVVDAVGAERPATDRLRHIAQLGFITRGWSYVNRGLEPPPGEVRMELTAPSGAILRFGPDGAESAVTGAAEDFCLVVTQRRHVDDTGLQILGEPARDWLAKAQAFAGPATDGPAPRSQARANEARANQAPGRQAS